MSSKMRIHAIAALTVSGIMGLGVLRAADETSTPGINNPSSPAADVQTPSADHQIMQQLSQIGQDPQTAPDKLFVLNTAIDNMDEIAKCQTAQAQAPDPEVKQLAQHMINDHQALGLKLDQTAQDMGMQLPHDLPRMKAEEGKIFASLSGKMLEAQFLADMNAGHAKAIACFEATSSLSQNAKIRQLASDTLPTLREHQQMVVQTAGALNIVIASNEAVPANASLVRRANGDAGKGLNVVPAPNNPKP